MKEIFEMMNKPNEFFKNDLSVFRGLIYFLIADVIFTFLTQTLSYYKILPSPFRTTFGMSVLINFLSIIVGFFLITSFMIFINIIIGGKNHMQFFAVLLYAITPALLFLWIPFIFFQVIILFWSIILVMIGVRQKEKFTNIKAAIFPIVFICLILVLTIISQNYIFLGFLK